MSSQFSFCLDILTDHLIIKPWLCCGWTMSLIWGWKSPYFLTIRGSSCIILLSRLCVHHMLLFERKYFLCFLVDGKYYCRWYPCPRNPSLGGRLADCCGSVTNPQCTCTMFTVVVICVCVCLSVRFFILPSRAFRLPTIGINVYSTENVAKLEDVFL